MKIQRGVFQGDESLLLLLVIAMMTLDYMLTKCTGGYELIKSREKINHLTSMDDIKLFAKKLKKLENLKQTIRIYCQDIGMEFRIEK